MKSHTKHSLYVYIAIIITLALVSSLFVITEQFPRPPLGLGGGGGSQLGWVFLNDGYPVDSEPGTKSVEALFNDQYLYYFFDTPTWDTLIGRLNLQTSQWELLTEGGWSTNRHVPPKPLTVTERITESWSSGEKFLQAFALPDNRLFGLYHGQSQVLPIYLDVHGGIYNFILDGDDITTWSSGIAFGEYDARTLLYSWNRIQGSMAIGDETAIAVGTYGMEFGSSPFNRKLTAVKYVPDAPDYTWQLWNETTWEGWSSSYRTKYVPLPHPNPPDEMQFTKAWITYNPAADEYLLLFYESSSGLCAAQYKDTEPYEWKWWRNGTWVNEQEFVCDDVSDGLISYGHYSKMHLLPLSNGEVSAVFSGSNHGIYELVYDTSAQEWSRETVSEQSLSSFVAEKDNTDAIWVVYMQGNDVKLLKKEQGVWTDHGTLFEVQASSAKIMDIAFLPDNTPVLFVLNERDERLYAYADTEIGDAGRNMTIEPQQTVLDTAVIQYLHSWRNTHSNASYEHVMGAAKLPNNMALDAEGNLFAPRVSGCAVLIHDQETDSGDDGYHWGGFWDYFFFPSAVAIDNTQEKVYISDYLTAGGSGGIYQGRVQVFNLSYNNESVWWKNYDDWPPGSSPQGGQLPTPNKTGFRFPVDVAVDENNGYLYVSESMKHRIRKYNVNSLDEGDFPTFLEYVGSEGSGPGELLFPQAIDVDSWGNLYVVDAGNQRIQKFDDSGMYLDAWGSYGIGNGQLFYPYGLAVDPTYSLVYVTDPHNKMVLIFSTDGDFLYAWNEWEGRSFSAALGGVVAYGNGDFAVGDGSDISKFSLTDTTDMNANGIPDVFESCIPNGCNDVCPLGCGHTEDPDCGTPTCDDNCQNDMEEGTDCGGPCLVGVDENCFNGIDDDKDCMIDCADSECDQQSHCLCWDGVCSPGDDCAIDCSPELICSDRTDNDEDTSTDCLDGDCDGEIGSWPDELLCEFGSEQSCTDEFDNDGDGLIDCADTECDIDMVECMVYTPNGECYGVRFCENGEWSECNASTHEICGDGFDNDCDNLTDSEDFECPPFAYSCLANIDDPLGNGMIDMGDLIQVIIRFGRDDCAYNGDAEGDWCDFADINRDGAVNDTDILVITKNYGRICDCNLGPELCDGYDNDCDAEIDDNVINCDDGDFCNGIEYCSSVVCVSGNPPTACENYTAEEQCIADGCGFGNCTWEEVCFSEENATIGNVTCGDQPEQPCAGAVWVDHPTCEWDTTACSESCELGERRCSYDYVLECRGEPPQWVTSVQCGYGCNTTTALCNPVPSCEENWMCSGWRPCSEGEQHRTCEDSNSCGTTVSKPVETRTCTPQVPATSGFMIIILTVAAVVVAVIVAVSLLKTYTM